MAEKWTKPQMSALAKAWSEHRCLYEVKSPMYHNRNLRKATLQKVREAVNIERPNVSIEICKSKFHSMRNSYNNERKKVTESSKSGAGAGDVSTPNQEIGCAA